MCASDRNLPQIPCLSRHSKSITGKTDETGELTAAVNSEICFRSSTRLLVIT